MNPPGFLRRMDEFEELLSPTAERHRYKCMQTCPPTLGTGDAPFLMKATDVASLRVLAGVVLRRNERGSQLLNSDLESIITAFLVELPTDVEGVHLRLLGLVEELEDGDESLGPLLEYVFSALDTQVPVRYADKERRELLVNRRLSRFLDFAPGGVADCLALEASLLRAAKERPTRARPVPAPLMEPPRKRRRTAPRDPPVTGSS